MKISAKIKSSVFVFLLGAECIAANRILEQAELNNNKRCIDGETDEAECSADQRDALNSKCVNQEEYATLVKMNYFPICTKRKGKKQLVGWCTCGCFAPNARLFSLDKSKGNSKWNAIKEIVENESDFQLWSLSDDTTLNNFRTEIRSILRSTSGAETKPLVFLHTAEGNILGITTEHAVLLSSGQMIAAKNLKVGHALISTDGTPVILEKIERKISSENVLNVLTKGESNLSHIVFAEGIAVGDLAWQNSLQSELNALAIREI